MMEIAIEGGGWVENYLRR